MEWGEEKRVWSGVKKKREEGEVKKKTEEGFEKKGRRGRGEG